MSRSTWVRDTLISRGFSAADADRAMAEVKAEDRAEAFNEAADHMAWALKDTPEYGPWVADQLRAMATATPAAAVPVPSAGDETAGPVVEATTCPHCTYTTTHCGQCGEDMSEVAR